MHEMSDDKLPGTANSFISSLLPVIMIAITTIATSTSTNGGNWKTIATFFAEPNIVMLITIIIATYTLGVYMGRSLTQGNEYLCRSGERCFHDIAHHRQCRDTETNFY
jgi:Gnt-I system high-affinity gluconate transporter